MIELNTRTNPFVGLRPFESSESEFFFGRDEQTKMLLKKLHQTNFVAVVGSSGSGKSSLVKAGLIPALKAGFLNTGDQWYFASFRPSGKPLYYFAKSLINAFQLSISTTELEKNIQEEGTDEIIDRIGTHLRDAESSLLILVDQFEELFTHFKNKTDQASLVYRFEFVKILLELLQSGLPIYIIITMRSDFIGKCNIFYGLPEALSNSQFLVPRLYGSELVEVIESPIKLFGGKMEPYLTQKILNDLKDGEDQLPVLEHALSQLWNERKSPNLITEEDYRSIGKLRDALSKHANTIYDSLIEKQSSLKPIIQEMFKYLIDFDGEKSEGVRQPRTVREIQNITDANISDIISIFEAFSAEGASFLYSPTENRLHENSSIDISHESLMREWNLFRKWKKEEERDKTILERLYDFATEYNQDKRDVLSGPELENYCAWKIFIDYKNPSKRNKILNWAKRYSINFDRVNNFINTSIKKQRVRKLTIRMMVVFVFVSTIVSVFAIYNSKLTRSEIELSTKQAALVAEQELNQALATRSSAQQALYEKEIENRDLRATIDTLENLNVQKDKLIKTMRTRSTSSDLVRQLQRENEKLKMELGKRANY